MKVWFVLRYHNDGPENGKYVAIDMSSGGYPYATDDPNQIRFFHSFEGAESYRRIDSAWRALVIQPVQVPFLNHIKEDV